MTKRNIVIGALGLVGLWVLVFALTSVILQNLEDSDAELEALVTPTERPLRTDVPILVVPTETATSESEESVGQVIEATEVARAEPTATASVTPRPSPAFTLSALNIERYQAEQLEAAELEAALKATVEIPLDEEEGAYPIRIAIADLGILSPVLVVQTDPNFDIVTPRQEVGHYALTSKIGGGGNSVMVGHVYPGRVFNKLLDAKVGQIVRVTDEHYREHYYRIEEIIRFPYEIGKPEDRELGFQYMYDDSEERITLVTCYPEFEWTHRFVVRAVPIDPEEVEDK